MRKLLRLLGRGLLLILALLIVGILGMYLADPAVVRNLVAGPEMGSVAQTPLNKPQEPVPGVETDDVPSGPQDTIAPEAIAAAERYATETDSVALLVYHRGRCATSTTGRVTTGTLVRILSPATRPSWVC